MTILRSVSPDPVVPPGPKLAEDSIWTAAEQLLSTCDQARLAAIDSNGLFVAVPSALPVLGHSHIEGHSSALELVAPADMARVIDAWRDALAVGASRVEVEPAGVSGARMMVHFFDLRARFQVFLCVAVPLDRQHRFRAARAGDDELRPRFTIVRKNELSEFVAVDESFPRLLGYRAEDVIGTRNLHLIHPDDHAGAIANWMDLLAAPGRSRRVRLRQRHADGRWIWFEVTNHNRLNEPEARCVVAEMVDISDEVSARESLAARDRVLHRLTESLPVGVAQLDADGLVVHRNDRLSALLGSPPGEQLPDLFANLSAEDSPAFTGALAGALRAGRDTALPVMIRRGDAPMPARITIRAIADAGGALIVVEDLSHPPVRPTSER